MPLARLFFYVWLFTMMSCHSNTPKEAQFSLKDTVAFSSMLEKGEKAQLFCNDHLVDTIDLHFGYHLYQGGVIFLAIDQYSDSVFFKTDYIYWNHNTRQHFKSLLPDFNDNFSSPAVIDSYFVYWGLKPIPQTSNYEIFAARYSLSNAQLDTIILTQESILTDFRFYFTPPFLSQGKYCFSYQNNIWKISPDWKTISKEKIPVKNEIEQSDSQKHTSLYHFFIPLKYYGKQNQKQWT